jgi:hypothetical protein
MANNRESPRGDSIVDVDASDPMIQEDFTMPSLERFHGRPISNFKGRCRLILAGHSLTQTASMI